MHELCAHVQFPRNCASESLECVWIREQKDLYKMEFDDKRGVEEESETKFQVYYKQTNGWDYDLNLGSKWASSIHKESKCLLHRLWHHGLPWQQGIISFIFETFIFFSILSFRNLIVFVFFSFVIFEKNERLVTVPSFGFSFLKHV